MGRKLIDLTGKTFTRLTVKSYVGRIGHAAHWDCTCSCGAEVRANGEALKAGTLKSCGCFRSDRMATLTLKHGARAHGDGGACGRIKSPEYKVWDGMKQRCCNPMASGYRFYGALGVSVCKEWISDFEAFLSYVGQRPSSRHSIDRYPNQGGNYEPGNVRWATSLEQARNRKSNKLVPLNGKYVPISVAAEIVGISRKVIACP